MMNRECCMKYFLRFCLLLMACINHAYSQDFVTSAEAETGVLTGVSISPAAGGSSGPFVTGFDNAGDKVTVSITVPVAGSYRLDISYRSIYGAKIQDLYANDVFVAGVQFPLAAGFVTINVGSVILKAGLNTLSIQKNWGYMDIDKFSIYTTPPNVFNITPSLIDAQANTATKDLYSFLLSQFGSRIISGATNDYYNNIKTLTGKSPLLRAWDMASYSPMYPYNWANGGFAFGAVDNHDAENAIDWYNSTNKKGMVAFHWHWGSPSGGTVGTNTFYTTNTVFDISKAVISGTQENTDALRDIDAIAVQLKKLQAAGVPVLWRPLHEAGGGWFWWGAKGSAAAKTMWDIMYDRLTNYHQLHNLIWVWSTPEPDWYPGNSKVDIIGFDSYPGAYNYTIQKNVFDNLYTVTTGNKLIAMSENGPLPNMDDAISTGAPWSYFMTWSDLAFSQNASQHILDVYNNARVITLENYTVLAARISGFAAIAENEKIKIQWSTSFEQNNEWFEIQRSSDGFNFSRIATVKGAGNSNELRKYSSYDSSPLTGINYYRLIQVSSSGRRNDCGTRMVHFGNMSKATVAAYPNPAGDYLGLVLQHYNGRQLSVSLSDAAGKNVYSKTITTVAGNTYYRLNDLHLPGTAVYMLQLKGKGLHETVRVLVSCAR